MDIVLLIIKKLKQVCPRKGGITRHRMAYQIPRRRALALAKAKKKMEPDQFPALCPTPAPALPALDFTKLSFEEEIVPVPERRFEPGWIRLSMHEGRVRMETDYFAPERSQGDLMNAEILRMKHRWVKFYKERGMEPYNYDYVPYEPADEVSSEEESSVAEDPEYESE